MNIVICEAFGLEKHVHHVNKKQKCKSQVQKVRQAFFDRLTEQIAYSNRPYDEPCELELNSNVKL